MTTSSAFDLPVGQTLKHIEYVALPGDVFPTSEALDVLSLGARLTFDGERHVLLAWQMLEGAGYLAAGSSVDNPLAVTVSADQRWSSLIGQRLIDHTLVFHETDQGRLPWSLRLNWGDAESLVVALGELGPHRAPIYSPDSLVITASEEVAHGYHPGVAESDAWGV